jgi:hypothetical protein
VKKNLKADLTKVKDVGEPRPSKAPVCREVLLACG